ncbi:hypothetical protein FGO68_gene17006 [Halteria grandinella]|uniref:Uncharacterized protein n=1 Tax=Halteria grandinella TaxID=5974 RepID=A0A8J8SXU7_HALGN|nr:hypothetical protein FGO68_gene17006 [Halteria grandinella]
MVYSKMGTFAALSLVKVRAPVSAKTSTSTSSSTSLKASTNLPILNFSSESEASMQATETPWSQKRHVGLNGHERRHPLGKTNGWTTSEVLGSLHLRKILALPWWRPSFQNGQHSKMPRWPRLVQCLIQRFSCDWSSLLFESAWMDCVS